MFGSGFKLKKSADPDIIITSYHQFTLLQNSTGKNILPYSIFLEEHHGLKDTFLIAWNFEYALIPCIIAHIVFDFPIILRRITRRIYVPIYFAFIPAGYSDELLAKYFDEDHYWVVGGPYPEEELKSARLRIIALSVGSLALTMTISPLAAGIFGTYALTPSQFLQFVWTLTIVKCFLLIWAYYDLRL